MRAWTTTPHIAAARQIYRAISQHPPGWSELASFGRLPHWVGQCVSSIVLALGDETITFVSLGRDSTEEGEDTKLRAVVVGESILVQATAIVRGRHEHADLAVTARSLWDLVQIDVKSGALPFDESGRGDWPGRPEAKLHFASGDVIAVPVAPIWNSDENQPLVDLVRRLPRFLGGARRQAAEPAR